MESIVVALITSSMTLIGVIVTVVASSHKQRVERQEDLASQQADIRADLEKQSVEIRGELAEYRAATDTKIDDLRREVEKHNGVVERTFRSEERIKTLFGKCEALREDVNEASGEASHAVERAEAAHNRLDRAGITSGLS